MQPIRNRERPLIILSYLAIYIIWGSTYLAMRIGVLELPPFLFAGCRHLSAGLLMLALALAARQSFPREGREYLHLALGGLLLLFAANGLVTWAEQWVSSSVAATILAIIPLCTALLETILHGRRLGLRGWAGLLLGLGGVAVLLVGEIPAGERLILASLVILLAALIWSYGMLYLQKHPGQAGLFPKLSVQMLAGGLALVVLGLVSGQAAAFRPSWRSLGALAYLVVFGSVVAYGAFNYLLQRHPAAKVATHAYVNPVVGVILGALVLAEPVTRWKLASLPLVLGGVLLVQTARIERMREDGESRSGGRPRSMGRPSQNL